MANMCSWYWHLANLAVNIGGSGLKSTPSVDGAMPFQLSDSCTTRRPSGVS